MAISERDVTTTDTSAPSFRASCDRKLLLKALTAVKGTVATRSPLPITSAVVLTAESNTLTITGTNLDTSMQYGIAAQMPHDSACVAEFKPLLNAVKALKSTTVDLSHDGKVLTVDGGRQAVTVPARYSVDDFPIIPTVFNGQSFMVPTGDLQHIAASIAPFASTDDTRPVLAGALITVDGDSLTIAAADGYTLATRTTTDMTGDDGAFIIPASTLKLFKHLPDGLTFIATADSVKTDMGNGAKTNTTRNMCEVQSGTVRIVSRVIEGSYPNLKQIIPTKIAGTFTVARSDLAEVLPMVLPVARDNSNAITFEVSSDGATLIVSAHDVEAGDVRAQIDVAVTGSVPAIQFNGTYVKRIVDTVDSTHLTWKISGPNSAAVVVPTDGADHTVVIMPMHTGRR